jgi:uridine kinase
LPGPGFQAVIEQLSSIILAIQQPHPTRVGIDGIDASGKTFLADHLAQGIESESRPVIRASIDGFHRPRVERYKRGEDSPEGYYEDSFDYGALREKLLIPLGPGGGRHYCRAVFDVSADRPVPLHEEVAAKNAILVFDGVFLLRPEIANLWDYHIYVDIDFEDGLRRAMERDLPLFGSRESTKARYLKRYYPGQRLYLEEMRPKQRANVILDNTDLHHPKLVFPPAL